MRCIQKTTIANVAWEKYHEIINRFDSFGLSHLASKIKTESLTFPLTCIYFVRISFFHNQRIESVNIQRFATFIYQIIILL